MQVSSRSLIGLLAGTAVLASAPAVGATERSDDGRDNGNRKLQVVGLTEDSKLIRFKEDGPSRARLVGEVTGLTGDAKLVGIDYRVQDGKLYGVGDAGGVYTLAGAQATKVTQLTIALQGTSFGVDFNPAANALRIVSDTGQNLRQPFATPGAATVSDGPLTNPATAPATGTVPATGVTGAAYTNNDLDPDTATTLFDIDSALDQVAIQSPANAGTLAATGKLGVDTTPAVGFDIYSTIRKGTTVERQGFASLTVGGTSRFYKISLLGGKASSRGSFASKYQVTGIAIPLDQL